MVYQINYATEHVAEILRSARESRGLSQRDLSARSGVPQGHISKIENGAVDLRISSLVELARVLDLEFALVPRKALPAVQAIVRSTDNTARELGQLRTLVHGSIEEEREAIRPAYSLNEDDHG